MSSLLNSGSSKRNIKWECLDGVKFPIFVHKLNGESYIPVDIINSLILSAFPSDPPKEIMTPLKTILLSSAQAELFQNVGYSNIKTGDNVVNYSQFLTFYEKVKEHFPEYAKKISENCDPVAGSTCNAFIEQNIVKVENVEVINPYTVKQENIAKELAENNKPEGENNIVKSSAENSNIITSDAENNRIKDTITTGWLQINQTYLPFLFKFEKIFVPTKIVRKVAKLKVPKTSVLLPDDDCKVLNEMCKVLNSENTNTINFDSKSKFSNIQVIRELNGEELKVLKYLPGNPVNCIQNNEGVAFDTFLSNFHQQEMVDSNECLNSSDKELPNEKTSQQEEHSGMLTNGEIENRTEAQENTVNEPVINFEKIIVNGKKMICLKKPDANKTFLPLEAVWRVFYQDVPLQSFIETVTSVLQSGEFCEINESSSSRLLELYGVTGVTLMSKLLLDETQLKSCWGPLKEKFSDQERIKSLKRKNIGSDDFLNMKKKCVQ